MNRTAYLVIWLALDKVTRQLCVQHVGIYSEPTPTSTNGYHPFAIYEITAADYHDAHREMQKHVNQLAKLDPIYKWIAKHR